MDLTEILALRSKPGAGIFMQITMRCPLSCAHCCTSSDLESEQHDESGFITLAQSFKGHQPPELLLLTGGEPLLRPALVERLADLAHEAGTRVALLSGMFFARKNQTPSSITRALDKVDHFTASLDAYHEEEVSREAVFRVLEERLALGQSVSLQVTGLGPKDPYLIDLAEDIRHRFNDQVPALFGAVGAQGRAEDWVSLPTRLADTATAAAPCTMASWPVVNCEGQVLACCNQKVIDGPAPQHLTLGTAGKDPWPMIRQRAERSEALRVIRTTGPHQLGINLNQRPRCTGACDACIQLSVSTPEASDLTKVVKSRGFAVREWLVAEMMGQQGYGIREFNSLSHLGAKGVTACVA